MKEIITLSAPSAGEYEEKRSRFLCVLCPVSTADEAQALVARVKKEHYDARHNAWAYLLSDGSKRCSDDGEPQGTAGLPILDALEKSGVTDVVAVVTRYFGGILLGTGGLTRAYSGATADALAKAARCRMLPCTLLSVACPYSDLEPLKRLLASFDATSDVSYADAVTVRAALPTSSLDAFRASLTETFAGRLSFAVNGEENRPVPV